MKRIARIVAASATVALAACVNEPLVFTSAQSFGIKVSVSTASTSPVDLSIGYESLDGTVVPVGAMPNSSASYFPIRACSNSAQGSGSTLPCADTDAGSQRAGAQGGARQSSWTPIPTQQPASLLDIANAEVVPQPGAPPSASNQTNSANDALSVFSSFNGSASGSGGSQQSSSSGPTAQLGLGKIFATGVAAQKVAEGQDLYQQYKGQASVYSVSTCLQNLATAMGAGKATSADVATCKVPTAPAGN